MKTHLKKKEEPKVDDNDVLNEDDFKKLIDAAWHPMVKAWIACHTETGARISEDGNMKVGDVLRNEYSLKLRFMTSKTKPRVCRVYYSNFSNHVFQIIDLVPRRRTGPSLALE